MTNEKNHMFEVLNDVASIFTDISDQWTHNCFEDNFCDFTHFSDSVRLTILQNIDFPYQLSELCNAILLFESKARKSADIWDEFRKRGFSAKKLAVFAWYMMERGLQTNVAFDDQKLGMSGARLYISICCLNGAQAFKIYHDSLFQKSVEVLQLTYHLLIGNLKCNTFSTSHASRKEKKRKKPCLKLVPESSGLQLQSEAEKYEIKGMFKDIIDSLYIMLNKVSLSASQQTLIGLSNLLEQLMRIDFSESTSTNKCRTISEFQNLENFADRSFALLHRLLDVRHSSFRIVYGHVIMPRLLYWTDGNTVLPTNAHPPKLMTAYKDAMVAFLRLRIEEKNVDELDSILMLIQNVCHRCPDRSDYRQKVAIPICEILTFSPITHLIKFIFFLYLFGTNTKVSCRGFAVELMSMITEQFVTVLHSLDKRAIKNEPYADDKQMKVEQRENSVEQDLSKNIEIANDRSVRVQGDGPKSKMGKKFRNEEFEELGPLDAMLVAMLRACNDKAPGVRSRAIMRITVLFGHTQIRDIIIDLSNKVSFDENDIGYNVNLMCGSAYTPRTRLLILILNKCDDAKVSTRKAAISALEVFFPALDQTEQIQALQVFKNRCRDHSVLVRKQAAEILSSLIASFGTQCVLLDSFWLSAVMPLIDDREQTVIQLASKLIMETLLTPIYKESGHASWRILNAVEQEVDHRRLLLRALIYQAKEGTLSDEIVPFLFKKSDETSDKNIVWMLIDFLSTVFKVDPSNAINLWFTLSDKDSGNIKNYVASVIARGVDRIDLNKMKCLMSDIGSQLMNFRVSESHLSAVYHTYVCLTKTDGKKNVLEEFNRKLIKICIDTLYSTIFCPPDVAASCHSSQENDKCAQLLVRAIGSVGEALQYTPSLLSQKLFDTLQLIVASDVIQQELAQAVSSNIVDAAATNQDSSPVVMGSKSYSQKASTFSTTSRKASQSQKTNSTGTEIRSSQPLSSQGLGPTFTNHSIVNIDILCPAVRAQAVLAIGKICLQDEKIAKKCVPVFAKQLQVNSNHVVRSNIVAVVCDLCKRYTLLVDRHSAILASCLRDQSTLVRKQTLMLLTHLIKEQFVRWEGQIMYRFVSSILDENVEIRQYAEMCLLNVLLVQFPNMFINHFLECIFYFNSVSHGSWLAAKAAREDQFDGPADLKCVLSGKHFRQSRFSLYKFMIKTLNDTNKFTLEMRIGQEVYAAVVEGILDIKDRNVRALLEDCYEIMCCPEIKLSMALGERQEIVGEDDEDEPPQALQDAAKKIVTRAFRESIIEAILPNLIQLKYFLQEKRLSDLEFGIIRVLRELCKDHCEQLDEFLASDRQLKAEIKFDLQKLEEREKRAKIIEREGQLPIADNLRESFVTSENIIRAHSSSIVVQRQCVESSSHSSQEQLNIGGTNRSAVKRENCISIGENFGKRDQINKIDKLPKIEALTPRANHKRHNQTQSSDGPLDPRAVSTPEHSLSDITFRLDNVSAIHSFTPKKRRKSCIAKPSVATINEVEDESVQSHAK